MKRGPRLPQKGSPFRPAQRELAEWRDTVLERDYRGATWSSSAILPHNIIELLTSYGPIHSLELYEQLIRNKADETWWESYGEELGGVVLGLQIEYVPVAPKPKKSKKRAPDSVPEDSAKKRTKNSHASTTSDPAHPPARAIVESDPTCSFRVHPQPPTVDAQSQPLQAQPMLATFSLSSAPSSSHLDSASAPASTLPQTQSSVPGSSVPPAPVYQQSRPTYPQATDPPSYPHQTYPHHAYPQHVYPQHAYSRYHPYHILHTYILHTHILHTHSLHTRTTHTRVTHTHIMRTRIPRTQILYTQILRIHIPRLHIIQIRIL
ncbi:hypothetical protein FRC09_000482 [Ceratobasidium sp. 395]|nr:hypothetical protein FRC09_000482 [Ceratobasidium sp. 395]